MNKKLRLNFGRLRKTKMLRILDLFAGIGGFSKALEATGGFETAAFCEIDPHAQQVLKKHWPRVPVFEDVRMLNGKLFKNVDVICGGFPCQDISVAGKQKGISDGTRSGLWFEYKRLIEEINPRWVVIENVRNLLSNGLATVLKDLSEIGYDASWEIISARDVGAPHLRERIWIVAYPNGRSIRKFSERNESGWNDLQTSWEAVTRDYGQTRNPVTTNAESIGIQGLRAIREQVSRSHDEETILVRDSEGESNSISNAHDFRFWPAFATEEEKLQWWASATAEFRRRWEVESAVCRVDDGLSKELDKGRAQRIKQLGNSIVPAIVEIIGQRILEIENEKIST